MDLGQQNCQIALIDEILQEFVLQKVLKVFNKLGGKSEHTSCLLTKCCYSIVHLCPKQEKMGVKEFSDQICLSGKQKHASFYFLQKSANGYLVFVIIINILIQCSNRVIVSISHDKQQYLKYTKQYSKGQCLQQTQEPLNSYNKIIIAFQMSIFCCYFNNKILLITKYKLIIKMQFDQSNSKTFGRVQINTIKLQQTCKKQQILGDSFDVFNTIRCDQLESTQKKKGLILDNFTDSIQTPRKQVRPNNATKLKRQEQSNKKIKIKYKVQQRTVPSKFVTIPLFIFTLIAVAILIGSIYNKYDSLHEQTATLRQQCVQDYEKNRCQKPLNDLKKYCKEKQICMNSSLDQLFKEKLKLSSIFGQIIKEMVEGAGLWVNSFIFVLIILGLVFGKTKHVTKEFTQYE